MAATSRAAAAIGLAGITGFLTPGYDADVIAVAGDPRDGLGALRDLRIVVSRGREFAPDALAPIICAAGGSSIGCVRIFCAVPSSRSSISLRGVRWCPNSLLPTLPLPSSHGISRLCSTTLRWSGATNNSTTPNCVNASVLSVRPTTQHNSSWSVSTNAPNSAQRHCLRYFLLPEDRCAFLRYSYLSSKKQTQDNVQKDQNCRHHFGYALRRRIAPKTL